MAKRTAYGAKLLLGDDQVDPGPETFTEIPGVQDFGAPFPTVENTDVTSHDSPERYREFVQTVRDGGEISVPVWFDFEDPTHQELLTATGEIDNDLHFQVEAPTGETIADFRAFVSVDGSGMFPVTGAQNITLNLRVTGAVELPFLTV